MNHSLADIPCFFHGIVEPMTHRSIQCFECRHVFKDGDELVRIEMEQWSSMWEEAGRVPTVNDILCCPLCIHDW